MNNSIGTQLQDRFNISSMEFSTKQLLSVISKIFTISLHRFLLEYIHYSLLSSYSFIVSYNIQNPTIANTKSNNLCTFLYSAFLSAMTFITVKIVIIGMMASSIHILKVNVLTHKKSKIIVSFKLSLRTFCIYFSSASLETAFIQYISPEKRNHIIISLI